VLQVCGMCPMFFESKFEEGVIETYKLADNPRAMRRDFKSPLDGMTHILFYCKYKHMQI
jgi:hypothetical protein